MSIIANPDFPARACVRVNSGIDLAWLDGFEVGEFDAMGIFTEQGWTDWLDQMSLEFEADWQALLNEAWLSTTDSE